MAETELRPLRRYAEHLEQVDVAELAQLDRWLEDALAASVPGVTGASAGVTAAKFALARRIALIIGLSAPPIVSVAVIDRHRPPPVATIAEQPLLERDIESKQTNEISTFIPTLTPEREPPSVTAEPEPRPRSRPRPRPRPRPRLFSPVPVPQPVPPLPKGDAPPSPEDLAQIDRARSLAHQAGRWAEAEAEYTSLIERSQNSHLVEVAYRELIMNLTTDGNLDSAKHYIYEYSLRFPDGRYLRPFQIMANSKLDSQ